MGSAAYRRAAAANRRAMGRSAAISRARSSSGSSFAPTSRASALTPETKYFDVGINNTMNTAGTDWTGTEVPCDNYVNSSGTAAAYTDSALIPSAIGSGYGQINGNRYKIKKIRVRGIVTAAAVSAQSAAVSGTTYRLMLVMDTQPNGAQAQGEDVMQDIGGVETVFAYKRVANAGGRFRILKDEIFTLTTGVQFNDAATTGTFSFEPYFFSFQYQPKTPILVNVKSGNSTPTVAGLETCNIFLLLATNNGSTFEPLIQASSRCYYCD